MKRTRLYRQIAALILLVMYAFIATPVHLWHHHSSATASVAKKPAITQKTVSSINLPGKASADNCPICAHKYSVYSDIEVTYTVPVASWTHVQYAYPDCSTLERTILYMDSRGPPTT